MHHLYAVMQVSMSEHVNHSRTHFSHALSHRFFSREFRIFDFRSTALVQLQGFFFSLLFHFFAVTENIFLVLFLLLLSRFLESTYLLHVSAFLQLAHEARRVTLLRYTLTIFFLSFSISPILCQWGAYARTLYVASSAFLSTENDLHHNLRPNIGGHTSRHNNRVPSKNLNGRGGWFLGEKDGYGGRTRGV